MKKRKLVLKMETVRVMARSELANANGGAVYLTVATYCYYGCQVNYNVQGIVSQPAGAGGCPGDLFNPGYVDPAYH